MRAMRSLAIFVGLAVLLGFAGAQTAGFATVQEAVQQLPELSLLNAQLSKISLADKLKDPSFAGTVFAPINEGLQPLLTALGGDISALGSSAQINDVFSTSVLTTKFKLEDLTDGQTLTTMNGNKVTVTVKTVNGGKVYYVNSARITTANILAGQGVIHEVIPILLPSSYQSMLDMIGYKDTSTVTPTVVYANPTAPTTTSGGSNTPTTQGTGSSTSGQTPTTGATAASPAPTTALSSPAPSGSTTSGSTSSGSAGSPSTATAGSSSQGTTNPDSSTNSSPAPSIPAPGIPTVPAASTTTSNSSNLLDGAASDSTGAVISTTTNSTTTPVVVSDSGLKDPNLGMSTASAGQSAAAAVSLLALPLIAVMLL